MKAESQVKSIENSTFELLKEVIDPELNVNIIDLGLVYEIEFIENNQTLRIAMTFSSKGCPMSDAILNDIRNRIENKFPNQKLSIEVVWEPEWTTERVTEQGKLALGF